MSFQGMVIICTESFGEFKRGNKYYCFAEEDDYFWIHAPWLESILGVNQIKVSSGYAGNFILEEF